MNPPDRHRWARLAGICCQALLLGTLLFLSASRLMTYAESTRIFRYEGF